MKMEQTDILKLSSSTKTTDAGGLTFGPAWLRQLSSGDSTKSALPPSPGLAFQLAKHRYGREEMLAIYESMEGKASFFSTIPASLEKDFEDVFKRDLQRPVLLYPPTYEEQKFLSTCVNSQVVLNSYNKIQGQPGGGGERGGDRNNNGENGRPNNNNVNGPNNSNGRNMRNNESGENGNRGGGDRNLSSISSRGGSNIMRGSRGGSLSGPNGDRGGGGGGRGERSGGIQGERGPINERGGGGRGRGRGRGTDSQHTFKSIEEENKSGVLPRKDGYTKTSYSGRNHWDDRDQLGGGVREGGSVSGQSTNNSISGIKKEYSRGMNEENWRNKAAENESNEFKDDERDQTSEETGVSKNENEESGNESSSRNSLSENNNNNNSRNWRNALDKPAINQQSSNNSREWPSYKKPNLINSSSTSNNNNNSRILNSDGQQKNYRNPEWLDDDDEENAMTFDESGQFISIKDLKNKRNQKPEKRSPSNSNLEKDTSKTITSAIPVEKDVNSSKNNNKEENSSNTKSPQSSNLSNKKSNEDGLKNSSQSQVTNQSLEQQKEKDENVKNSNIDISNKNETIQNLQQQLLQSKLQMNDETALKLSQLGLNEFTIKNLQNAPLNEQLLIANVLQNLTLNQNKQQQQPTDLNQVNINKNTDPKLGAVSLDHPDAENWFYADPQNQIQGAFSSEQMAGWFTAGYFTLSLMIKRGCDDKFLPLGVVSNNWGRIPFTPGPPQPPLIQQQVKQQQQPLPQQQNWSKEQIVQQMQVYQQMSQLQFFPQNFALFRNEIIHQVSNNMNMSHLGSTLAQLQQLQLQQKAAASSVTTLGHNTVLSIMHDLRSQQETLINQFSNITNKLGANDPSIVDPAILGASTSAPSIITSNKSQSIWGDIPNRISPQQQITPPNSISPINNLNVNQLAAMIGIDSATAAAIIAQQLGNTSSTNQLGQMLNDTLIKDKIQALFEQTKKDEERKRKMEEEYQVKLKQNDDEKRRILEEMRIKEEEQKRLLNEERIREEMRKELQKKKLEEIIKMQEEEKRRADDLKRSKEEEQKTKHVENKKKQQQKEDLKKVELLQQHQLMQQAEENERKRQHDQAKQQELNEKQKQKLQQDHLNNLQLPAHANWANSSNQSLNNQQQQQALQLKSILEQQELESMQLRALHEQQKQQEQQANQQNNPGGKWSNLFRGAPQAPTNIFTSTNTVVTSPEKNANAKSADSSIMSLASIQAEQTRLETKSQGHATTMSQKLLSQQTPPKLGGPTGNAVNVLSNDHQSQKNSTSWAAWGNSAATNNLKSNMNDFSIAQSLNGPTPAAANSGFNHNYTTNNNSSNNTVSGAGSGGGGGFWGELSEPKKTNANGNKANSNPNNKNTTKPNKSNAKNQPFPDLQQHASQNHHNNNNNDSNFHQTEKPMSKQQKKIASVEESVQHAFLRNMTISEEFMKWCQDQLQYFHVDLHIPTFVNFLREIETCAEIEDYVINYLGDTQQAKDFAQQFFINRESQISQQSNHNEDLRENDDSNSQFQTKGDTQFSKQRQKKRSKGQRLDNQLLGFTVQPDPNLQRMNRGDIDPL